MDAMDETREEERKAAALMALALNFGKELPEALAGLWLRMLRQYSASAVEAAVVAVLRSYEYKTIPPFAELQKHLPKGYAPMDEAKALALKASAEWDQLLEAIRRHGYYDEPILHPTTSFVLRGMGGWRTACTWKTDELQWRKKEFLDAWMQADGEVTAMEGGATEIERRQAQIALGEGDDRTLRKITRNVVKRLEQRTRDADDVEHPNL